MKKITLKPSTRVNELVDFIKSNIEHYSDVTKLDKINICTLKGNIAGDDRRLRALTEMDLSNGIEISIENSIEATLDKIETICGIKINYIESVDDSNSFLDYRFIDDISLNSEEWNVFSEKLSEKNILPQLTFIFNEVLSEYEDELDNHFPFFYIEDAIIGQNYEGFLYANIDGVFSNCTGNGIVQIQSWDNIEDVYYVDDEGTREYEPDHLTLLTTEGGMLSISKDDTLNFLSNFWKGILGALINETRGEQAIVWGQIEKKLKLTRMEFSSWDEIREFIK